MRTHLEPFLREAADRAGGAGLPRFIEDEFRAFLTCGAVAHGCARLRCEGCGLDRLVAAVRTGVGPSALPRGAGGLRTTLLAFQRRQGARSGFPGGRAGSLTVIQRFGGALNLSVHFHTLVLDGVFTTDSGAGAGCA